MNSEVAWANTAHAKTSSNTDTRALHELKTRDAQHIRNVNARGGNPTVRPIRPTRLSGGQPSRPAPARWLAALDATSQGPVATVFRTPGCSRHLPYRPYEPAARLRLSSRHLRHSPGAVRTPATTQEILSSGALGSYRSGIAPAPKARSRPEAMIITSDRLRTACFANGVSVRTGYPTGSHTVCSGIRSYRAGDGGELELGLVLAAGHGGHDDDLELGVAVGQYVAVHRHRAHRWVVDCLVVLSVRGHLSGRP